MIGKIFEIQNRKRTPKDWITTVIKDLEELTLNLTFSDIKQISKENWKQIVKRKIIENSLKNLLEKYRNILKL